MKILFYTGLILSLIGANLLSATPTTLETEKFTLCLKNILALKNVEETLLKQLIKDQQLVQNPSLITTPLKNTHFTAAIIEGAYKKNSPTGDFYKLTHLDGNQISILLGDVSGHGTTAAQYSLNIHKTFADAHFQKHIFKEEQSSENVASVVLDRLSKNLEINYQTGETLPVTHIVLDSKSGLVQISNGGNPPALIVKKNGDIIRTKASGRPIGLDPKIFPLDLLPPYQTITHQLEDGDIVICLTDGITDAFITDGKTMLTSERGGKTLDQIITKARNSYTENQSESLAKHITRTISEEIQNNITDDHVMIALQYNN